MEQKVPCKLKLKTQALRLLLALANQQRSLAYALNNVVCKLVK